MIPLPMKLVRLLLPLFVTLARASAADAVERPNVLVIVSDDHGYEDVGFQKNRNVTTPHLDSLAASGLRCTNGYVTHPFCSPTRAGLLTGRYQQRFGHERNPFYDPADAKEGLPLSETLFPAHLAKAGYATGWVGKWHLGATPEFSPFKRGFTEGFGFIGGGHRYQNWEVKPGGEYNISLLRNGEPVEEKEHLTTAFGREASAFIKRHEAKPWFLYLAFNAPHTPHEPTPEALAKFSTITDPVRQKYLAQLSLMDDAVGSVLGALKETDQTKKTLVFFFSDNGGPIKAGGANGSSNRPLRGGKGDVFDGGVRVPFVVSWPGTLPEGKDYTQPVSSLDVMATALGVAGVPMPTDKKYDSVNLLPFLKGKDGSPHERLFWRNGEDLAVREGMWKLVRIKGKHDQLFEVGNRVEEERDLSEEQPDVVHDLAAKLDSWNKELVPPAFPGLSGRAKPKAKEEAK